MLPSACDVGAWLRDNRNGFETHDRGGRIEDSKGECVREGWKKIMCKVSMVIFWTTVKSAVFPMIV